MKDAGHEAEHRDRGQQPHRPYQNRDTLQVTTWCTNPPDQQDQTEDQRGGKQPPDTSDLRRLEQPAESGLAPRVRRGAPAQVDRRADAEGPHATGLVAIEAPDPVVAQRQFENRVVLGAADPRSPVGRPHLNQQHPPTGSRQRSTKGEDQAPHPVEHRPRAGQQVAERQCGHHQSDFELLGQIAQPEAPTAEQQPPQATIIDSPQQCPHCGDHQEHQQRVGVVVTEDRDRDRGQSQHHTGNQAGGFAEGPAHGVPQDRHRGDTHHCLGHKDAPGIESEQPYSQGRKPQRQWRFVDGDRVRGVRRPEQEGLRRLRAGLRGSGVESVGPA